MCTQKSILLLWDLLSDDRTPRQRGEGGHLTHPTNLPRLSKDFAAALGESLAREETMVMNDPQGLQSYRIGIKDISEST